MSMMDREILEELILESREHLTAIEPDLLLLEQNPDAASGELVNRVFRAIHSIKGGFGFFGLQSITRLSHAMESVLMRVRDGETRATGPMVDALLRGTDRVSTMLNAIDESDAISISQELLLLVPFLEGEMAASVAAAATPPAEGADGTAPELAAAVVAAAEYDAALRKGRGVYRLVVLSHTDLKNRGVTPTVLVKRLLELGDILDVTLSIDAIGGLGDCLRRNLTYTIMLASALDRTAVVEGSGIPAERVMAVELAAGMEPEPVAAPDPVTAPQAVTAAAPATGASAGGVSSGNETLRVKVDLLDGLINLAGELVLGRNQVLQRLGRRLGTTPAGELLRRDVDLALERARAVATSTIAASGGAVHGSEACSHVLRELDRVEQALKTVFAFQPADDPSLKQVLANLDCVTSQLQESIMHTRMQPVGVVFQKFTRIIRDLSRSLGKEIELVIFGADVELDKSIVEGLSDPLTHLIRNSADHGVEAPAVREAAGKPTVGTIRLTAFHEGGQVIIEIQDDGKGLDVDILRRKAVERGILSAEGAAALGEREVFRLIFHPGFSTATVLTDVSGRGVGMDVVRTNVEALGGEVTIESQAGAGTTIRLALPLTLAILPSLIVRAGDRRFAVPQASLEEVVRLDTGIGARGIERLRGTEVMRLRGRLLPLLRLTDALHIPVAEGTGDATRRQPVLVLAVGGQRYGLIVDRLLDIEEIVVKPLSAFLKDTMCYAGATIMGDGKVAMILDAAGIAESVGLALGIDDERAADADQEARAGQSEQQAILLFKNHPDETFALNLELVSRLERVHTSQIDRIGGKEYLRYSDHSLRLVRLHEYLPVAAPPTDSDRLMVVVPKLVRQPIGIVASRVSDAVRTTVVLDEQNIVGKGILGSAVIRDALTIFLDVFGLVELAFPESANRGPSRDCPSGLRVLLAEDSPFFQTLERRYLEDLGCSVDVVADGSSAWNRLAGGDAEYDLLVTDVEMPNVDGLELTRRIRNHERLRNLRVVALSALDEHALGDRLTSGGFDGYGHKLDRDGLARTLARFVEGGRAHV